MIWLASARCLHYVGTKTGQTHREDDGHRNAEATYQMRMENSRTREWAQWVKSLPCKCEDLSSIPIIHVNKLALAAYAVTPGRQGEDR